MPTVAIRYLYHALQCKDLCFRLSAHAFLDELSREVKGFVIVHVFQRASK